MTDIGIHGDHPATFRDGVRRFDISIVVPVYNEAGTTDVLLEHLDGLDAGEVIVVDGTSSDGTWERLTEARPPSVRLLRVEPGRARQMNTGALYATGEVLLFLHADTRLPDGALQEVAETLTRRQDRLWGCFDVRFDRAGPLLKLVAWSMNRRSLWSSICTGDQAIFVYRREFLETGGFAPVALMEDVDLARRLKRRSRPLRIHTPVTTSSRRWREHGTGRTIILMWRLRWLYWWGAPTSALSERYYPDQ